MKKSVMLTVLVVAVYLLHQDFWNWKRIEPLIFGFLPIGLAYHVGYSLVAALTMAVLVRWAWPKDLAQEEASYGLNPTKSKQDP